MTITLTREEAQKVLDAVEYPGPSWFEARKPAAELIRAKLSEPEPPVINGIDCSCGRKWRVEGGVISASGAPEPEPVAWISAVTGDMTIQNMSHTVSWAPLYTAPPQREWVGLIGDEWEKTNWSESFRVGAKWAEAYLKDKNT